MKFNTKFEREEYEKEKGGGKIITESAGYIPPKIQIEQMIMAGQRLDLARKEQFDFGPDDEIDEDYVDPTREPGFDLADASQLASETAMRLRQQEEKPSAMEKAEKEKKASEEASQEKKSASDKEA